MPAWVRIPQVSQGYWRNRKRACLASTRYWDRNPDTPFRYGVVGNISACHADAQGSIPCFGVFFFPSLGFCYSGGLPAPVRSSYGHTTVKAPHPIRTAKLSIVGPDQYFGRGLQGNLGCCMSFLPKWFFYFFFGKKKKIEGPAKFPGREI